MTSVLGDGMVVCAARHVQRVEDVGLDIIDIGRVGESRNDLREHPVVVVVVLHDLPDFGRWL